jgi:2-polyprenyl-3-methyl-5-hydroxy-6-metoxy-1,4-benzoquinol methylase
MHSAACEELETANCPLCGAIEWTPVVRAEDPDAAPPRPTFAVVRCRDCGLSATNPRPTPSAMGKFYAADYAPHEIARPKHAGGAKAKRVRRFSLFRNYERGDFPPIGQNRALDFGCGGGAFLLRMRDRGWNVTGVDFSEDTVERLREELGLNVLAGTLPHPDLSPGAFDLVTLWHSLEHVPEPLGTLREVHRLLAPGGRVLVAVPNLESVSFRWFGADWFGLDVPRHLTHFTPGSLAAMLEKAGFRVLVRQNSRHSLWFRNSVERARRNGNLCWPQSWMRSKLASSIITRLHQLLGRSDAFLMIAEKVS